jgi:Ribonuclease G/E
VLIAVSARAAAARIALLDGDVLAEFYLWDRQAPDGVGDIHTGRVTARAPAMAGCFVDLGHGQTGFLPDSAGGKALTVGDYLTVRVSRAAQSGKGARLAAAPGEPADKPGLLRRGPGPLLDLAARFPAAGIVIDDHALIAALRPALEGRMSYRADCFDPVLEDEVASLAEPTAALSRGAKMHVAVTAALTAIDIDAGAATGDMGEKAHSQLALNAALLPEIIRQIVLRNLSGGILIDFAGMKSAARPKLATALDTALARDPLKPKFLGFSHLGYAELTRPRIRPPLHELLNR